MIGRERKLLEPRLRQEARIEKSQPLVEKDILAQRVRKENQELSVNTPTCLKLCTKQFPNKFFTSMETTLPPSVLLSFLF